MEEPHASDLEKLRGLYADWATGDFSRAELFDPEVEMRGYGWPEDMQASGLEQLGVVMAGWFEPWQRPAVVEAEEFIVQRGRIAVLIRWRGRGRESGTPMESEGAHLWTFRNGKAVRYEVYRDRDQALAALHEQAGDGDH